jgi:hypothetical protein
MKIRFRPNVRHPFFTDVAATPAPLASGTCASLAGTLRELRVAAAEGVRPRRAVYVLHGPQTPFLTGEERDELWRAFQVPVYGILVGSGGRPAAWECEMLDGLHFDELTPRALPKTVERTEQAACECGRPGSRLMFTRQMELALAGD